MSNAQEGLERTRKLMRNNVILGIVFGVVGCVFAILSILVSGGLIFSAGIWFIAAGFQIYLYRVNHQTNEMWRRML